MNEFAITAIGHDRPGIVAGFTEVLLELGCNLADCSMTLLRDQFAMILLVEAPDDLGEDRLDAALQPPAQRFDLLVHTRPVHEDLVEQASAPFVLSVYGRDRPGIVHAVAKVLAEAEVNITDLRSHLAGEDLYAMILDCLGVSVTLRDAEAAEL
jgi:glycine cleavage system transcriptional repressor